MRFDELNWFDLERYLKTDDRLLLIFGACEQHGYLSLLTDVKIPQALADTASKQTGVPVAPPIMFGLSSYFASYPGTLSLRASTLFDLAEDLVRSAYNQGFRKLLFLNGHGGNDPVKSRLYEIINQLPDLKITWFSWWQSHSVEAIAIKHELKSYHAGWIEAFPFTKVCELPGGEKLPPTAQSLLNADEYRKLYGDGVFGGKYEVDASIMEEIFNAALQDVLHLIHF
jgi:creatinine amidohydrolase